MGTRDFEFTSEEVGDVLKSLHLNSFTMGDYLVVVNGVADITYLGEPYLALQLWFNMSSGCFIGRVWSQSVSTGKVRSIAEFREVTNNHLQGRPCLGDPIPSETQPDFQDDFVFCQTPVPRRMSRHCQKILSTDTKSDVVSCEECLKFRVEREAAQSAWGDTLVDVKQEDLTAAFQEPQDESHNDLRELKMDKQEGSEDNLFDNNITESQDESHNDLKELNMDTQKGSEDNLFDNNITESQDVSHNDLKEPNMDTQEGSEDNLFENNITESQDESHNDLNKLEMDTQEGSEDNLFDNNITDVYKRPRQFKCDKCEYSTTHSMHSLISHIRTVHEKKRDFKCSQCDYAASSRYNLNSHVRCRHEKRREFKCSQCDYAALSKAALIGHVKKIHEKNRDKRDPATELYKLEESINHLNEKALVESQGMVSPENQEPGPLDDRCTICGKMMCFTSLNNHMRLAHGRTEVISRKCPWCDKILTSSTLRQHAMKFHLYGNFLCQKCGFKAYFAKKFIEHVNEEHKDEGYSGFVCPSCNITFPYVDIENHYKQCITQKMIEKSRKSNKISLCSKICDLCGKMLTTMKGYRLHMKTHLRKKIGSGEEGMISDKLYHYCDKCGQKYTTTRALRNHVLQVHEKARFPCQSCPMTFDTENKRRCHEKSVHSTDERFQCKKCDYRSGSLGDLKVHEESHGDCKYQCKYCPKKLRKEISLIAHERQHTGEKPFKCSMCENAFTSKNGLRQHMNGTHKIVGPRGGKPGWNNGQEKKFVSE